jgi:CheY-like chemotaxis protein
MLQNSVKAKIREDFLNDGYYVAFQFPRKVAQKATVLVVDDSALSLRGLERILSKEYTVYKCANAQEAIDLLKKIEVDIIVTDCDMPGKDGLWLLDQVRQKYPDIYRILVSASEKDKFDEAVDSGLAQVFLAKPVHPEKLIGVLRYLI